MAPGIEQYIRDVPDFPKPGILFKDITPLLQDPEGLRTSIDLMAEATSQYDIDIVCGIESRGFRGSTDFECRLRVGSDTACKGESKFHWVSPAAGVDAREWVMSMTGIG